MTVREPRREPSSPAARAVAPAIAWTWNSAGRRGGTYTWTMEAGRGDAAGARDDRPRAAAGAPPPPAPSFLWH